MPKKNNQRENHCPVPKGILVVIGGAENKGGENDEKNRPGEIKLEVLENFMRLMKAQKPHVEVITTGGVKDPDGSFREYQKVFNDLGAGVVNHIHHVNRKDVDDVGRAKRLETCDGIFVAGGDQLRITSIYGGTHFLTQLKQRYIHDPIVIGGTSAGAMALSTPMIYAGVGSDQMISGKVSVTTGLEFIRDVCIDTHFVDRGRFVRMAQVIATNPTCIGVGIEEDTCLIIRDGMEAEVIGSGVVIILNGQSLQSSNMEKDELITMRGLQVDILAKGEKYSIPQINPPHQ